MKAFRYEALLPQEKKDLAERMSTRTFGRTVTVATLAFYSEEKVIQLTCCRSSVAGIGCECSWIFQAMTKEPPKEPDGG